jgi:hypothetical protein
MHYESPAKRHDAKSPSQPALHKVSPCVVPPIGLNNVSLRMKTGAALPAGQQPFSNPSDFHPVLPRQTCGADGETGENDPKCMAPLPGGDAADASENAVDAKASKGLTWPQFQSQRCATEKKTIWDPNVEGVGEIDQTTGVRGESKTDASEYMRKLRRSKEGKDMLKDSESKKSGFFKFFSSKSKAAKPFGEDSFPLENLEKENVIIVNRADGAKKARMGINLANGKLYEGSVRKRNDLEEVPKVAAEESLSAGGGSKEEESGSKNVNEVGWVWQDHESFVNRPSKYLQSTKIQNELIQRKNRLVELDSARKGATFL